MIHISRPTGRGIEAALHVNASAGAAGEPIAFLNLFNPTAAALVATLRLPLYYAAALPASRLVRRKFKELVRVRVSSS